MPWELEIHIIDVGQGESSLIIARNAGLGLTRSMLIDGGLATYARTIHDYMLAQGLVNGPDHILVTHYDRDHMYGITALLTADNLYLVSDMIATPAASWAHGLDGYNSNPDRAAAAAATAYAVALGCYDDPPGVNTGMRSIAQIAVHQKDYSMMAALAAADNALLVVEHTIGPTKLNPRLIQGPTKIKDTARAAGLAAAASIAAGDNLAAVIVATRTAVFNCLSQANGKFQTGGIYHNTHVIDIGDTGKVQQPYTQAIAGRYLDGGTWAQAVGTSRVRMGPPALGSEMLWNSGHNPGAAPAGSPAVFVVARLQSAWNGPNGATGFNGPQADNAASICLIVRFNRFFYFTGGDLASEGEDLIVTAVTNYGLPDPQGAGGATFAPAARIACFKCGHHGSHHSTSQYFLNTALPRGAFISCGHNQFGEGDNHPTGDVVDRLHGDQELLFFYLTNCKYFTTHIPASHGLDQLGVANNKSRVAGEHDDNVVNAEGDVASQRERGNICISLNQTESASAYPQVGVVTPLGTIERQYHVSYFEEDAAVNNNRIEDTVF